MTSIFSTSPSRGSRRFLALALVGLVPASALSGPAASGDSALASKTGTETPIELSPFIVNTARDTGFVATSSLAGGRLAGELKDTPVAYSVLTRDFIDALDLTDLASAAEWTVNSTREGDDGRNLIFGSPTTMSFRGAGAGAAQRDFVEYPNTNFDSYNLERFDFSRGPNAILFGIGGVGGTANLVTRRAQTDRARSTVKVSGGSWQNHRGTIDMNQPLSRTLAVRVNLLGQDSGNWRDRLWEKKEAVHLAGTYRPTRALEFRAEAEWGHFSQATTLTTIADMVSGWDGVTTFAAPTASNPANATATGVERTTGFVYSNLLQDSFNAAGMMRTLGGNANAAVPAAGVIVVGPTATISGQPILNQLNVSGNLFDRATAGSAFILPGRAFTVASDAPGHDQNYRLFSGFVNTQLGSRLFFEGAATVLRDQRKVEAISVRGLANVYIDLTRTLPSGQPNPGYLQPYSQSPRQRVDRLYENTNFRAAAAYVLDHTRWGDFRFNLIAGTSRQESEAVEIAYVVKQNADARRWGFSNPLSYQFYWPGDSSRTLRDVTKVTSSGTTYDVGWARNLNSGTSASRIDLANVQSAASAAIWERRIHLVAAVRHDRYRAKNYAGTVAMDYPADWDGNALLYKPPAPADYSTLRYVPKAANGEPAGPETPADARPRDAAGTGLAQYAHDRFRDDFSPPDIDLRVTTFSTGAVWHAKPWLSAFVNFAETFSPGPTLAQIDGSVLPPSTSTGWDAGLRFSLLKGRLAAVVNRYEGRQKYSAAQPGVSSGIVPAFPTAINNIVNANAVGDLSSGGYNIRGLALVPANYNDRRLRETAGYEFEITANPTKEWRVSLNAALPKAYSMNAFPDTRAYLERNGAVLRQIVQDAGVLIDAGGVATVDQSVPAARRSPDANTAATAWNGLQNNLKNLAAAKQVLARSTDFTGNVFADYTFVRGALKNLKVGAGVNVRGREVIGFRGADTIVNPANAQDAIDDPSVDQYTPVYRGRYNLATAVIGYKWTVRKKYTINVDLRIDNLLDEDVPLYYNLVTRPLGGNLQSPARVATPNQYSYLTPRSYSLSTTLQF